MQPLLTKKPSKVALHVGTNVAGNKDALLDLKKEIETKIPDCAVALSMPMWRLDNRCTGKIIEALNKKILSFHLNVVNNQNKMKKTLGEEGCT